MKKFIIVTLFIFISAALFAQLREFSQIFPNINQDTRAQVFSTEGYVRTSQRAQGFVILANERGNAMDPSIINMVMDRNPGYFVESIKVIPGSPSLLDIYNALGNIRGLRGRLYDSHSRGEAVPLFEEATRIAAQRQTSGAIPDPAPSRVLPRTETIFIRLKDVNFGYTYYLAEMSNIQNGIRYTMSNFRTITYIIPVIREGRFIAQLYIEPIQEGVLIYSAAGADASNFVSSRIHVESAISKRLGVISSWAADGIR